MSLSLDEIDELPYYEWLLGIRLAQRINGKLIDLDNNILFFTRSEYELFLEGIGPFKKLDEHDSLFEAVQLSNGDDAYLVIDDMHSKNGLSQIDYDVTISEDCELAKLIRSSYSEIFHDDDRMVSIIISAGKHSVNNWIEHSMPNNDKFNDMMLRLQCECNKLHFNRVVDSDEKLNDITEKVKNYIDSLL